MRKGLAAILLSFWLILSPNVWAQDVVDWVEPTQQRITVVANADEHRQVRFTGGWKPPTTCVRMARSERRDGLPDRQRRQRLDRLPVDAGEIPRLFRVGSGGEVMLGKSGRGSFLLGTAFGQRFTIAGNPRSCFTFVSSDPQQALYGYACAATEPSRAEIEDFLRDSSSSTTALSKTVRRTSVDRHGCGAPIRARPRRPRRSRGLTEVPLGYAVLNPIGGGYGISARTEDHELAALAGEQAGPWLHAAAVGHRHRLKAAAGQRAESNSAQHQTQRGRHVIGRTFLRTSPASPPCLRRSSTYSGRRRHRNRSCESPRTARCHSR